MTHNNQPIEVALRLEDRIKMHCEGGHELILD